MFLTNFSFTKAATLPMVLPDESFNIHRQHSPWRNALFFSLSKTDSISGKILSIEHDRRRVEPFRKNFRGHAFFTAANLPKDQKKDLLDDPAELAKSLLSTTAPAIHESL